MVNEQRELQMNVGKAMDVLTKDYPYFLRRAPGKYILKTLTYIFLCHVFVYVSKISQIILSSRHLNRLLHLS
jgi:hypothetical protein